VATPKLRMSADALPHTPQLFCPCCSLPLVYRPHAKGNAPRAAPPGAQLFDCPACGLFDRRGAGRSGRPR
jgi:hypothetical protein